MEISTPAEPLQMPVRTIAGHIKGPRGNVEGFKAKPAPKPPKGEVFILPKIPFGRGTNRFAEMVKWWIKLTDEQLNVLIIYVYRGWPVCDVKVLDPNADVYTDKLTGPCPFTEADWKSEILGRYGSGSYTFLIKEGNVQRWTVYTNELVDLQNHPPLIDYKTLMLSAPANKDFVKWARSRNMIEQDTNDGGGMANAAIEQMANTQERMADRLMDMADRVAAAKESGGGVEAQTQSRLVEMVIDASTRANSVALDMVKQNATSKDQQTNPLELIDRIVSVAASLNGGHSKDDSAVMGMMQRMLDAAEKRADRLEAEMRERKHDEEGEEKGLLGSLTKLGELKSVFTDLGIIKPDTAPDAVATTGSNGKESITAMLIKEGLSKLPGMIGEGGIAGLMSSFAQVIAAAKMQPIAVPAGGIGQIPQPNPNVQQMNAPQPQPANPPRPAPVVIMGYPMPARTGVATLDELNLVIWRITPTFIHHLSADNLDGYTFARWFIESDSTGRQRYDQMKEAEAQETGVIKKILEGYPPLWNVISTTPAKLDKFLGEFIRLDEWEAEGAMDGDDDGEPMPVAAAPAKNVKGTVIK